MTKILNPTIENIKEAAAIIKNGGLVSFPTETVYGLGANALDEVAAKKIYEAKGRPSDNPMIVHIARASDLGQLTPMLSEDIVKLVDHFWPGPLTLVLEKKDGIPKITTGGLDTVAVRMPDDEVALALINLADCPVAAPSANLSGRPSPTKAEHVIKDFEGKIDAIITGEDCKVGIESTVLDMTSEIPTILRPGILSAEDISTVLNKEVIYHPSLLGQDCDDFSKISKNKNDENLKTSPKSPGMKYKHYAPKAQMIVVEGSHKKVKEEIERLKILNERLGNEVGVILFEEKEFTYAAQNFFAELRDLDEKNLDLILAGAMSSTDGVGFAVMNRMFKAAGYNIVRV
ncbi:MAG: L-threonylcarbamoyladenylate synthase [Anaerovoracaceae bacterium]